MNTVTLKKEKLIEQDGFYTMAQMQKPLENILLTSIFPSAWQQDSSQLGKGSANT